MRTQDTNFAPRMFALEEFHFIGFHCPGNALLLYPPCSSGASVSKLTPTLCYLCAGVCGRADCILQVAGGVSGVMIEA